MKMTYAVAAVAAACSMTAAAQAATVTVYNPTQLTAAVKAAKAGDTIRVAPGNYGAFEFKNVNPRSAINIVAANSARMPVFTNLKVTKSSNLKLTQLIASSPMPQQGKVLYAGTITRSKNIQMTGMVFRGVAGGGVARDPRGLRISGSTNVTIAGNSFTELSHAILTDGSTRMNISDNGFSGIRVDGIISDGASGSTITRNRFANFRPQTGDHPDAIQVFNLGNATTGLTVSDNLIIGDAKGQMQGIFLTNDSGIRGQLDQVRVSNNLMWGTMYNGITAATGNRVTISGNKLYSNARFASPKTWVRLEDVASATVSTNYAGAYLYNDVSTLVQSGNVLSLLDLLAASAVTRWDATHMAAQLSLPYYDGVSHGFETETGSMLAARRVNAFAPNDSSSFGRAALGAVPEPAGWTMMIASFALIGVFRRNRAQRLSV